MVWGNGRDFGVSFNSEKSKVMILNRSEDEIEGKELQQTQKYKYLGVWMSANGCIRARMSVANQGRMFREYSTDEGL